MANDFPAVTSSSGASTSSVPVMANTATSGISGKVIGVSQSPARLRLSPQPPQPDSTAQQLAQLNLLGQFENYEQFVRFQHFQDFQHFQQLQQLQQLQTLQREVSLMPQTPLPAVAVGHPQHPEADTSRSVREEVIEWCNQYWWNNLGDTKKERVDQLLLEAGKPDKLKTTELYRALSIIDSNAPCFRAIEYAFHDHNQQIDPRLVSWLRAHLCKTGSIEFQLLTLLKRDDAPVKLTPKILRAALLEADAANAYSPSTIHKAFNANKIVLSPQMMAWVINHWSDNQDFTIRQKIELLMKQPDCPKVFNAAKLYIALFYLLGEDAPGMSTVSQIFDTRERRAAEQQLSELKQCWEQIQGSVLERLITLLYQPQMQQWRDTRKLYEAMRKLYNENAPLKNQIRYVVTYVNDNASAGSWKWASTNRILLPEVKTVVKTNETMAMPQPINTSPLYSLQQLKTSHSATDKTVLTTDYQQFKHRPVSHKDDLKQVSQDIDARLMTLQQAPASPRSDEIIEWLNQPAAQQTHIALSVPADITPRINPQETGQEQTIAEMYQRLVQVCSSDFLDRALQFSPTASPDQTDTQRLKRNASPSAFASEVIKRPRQQ